MRVGCFLNPLRFYLLTPIAGRQLLALSRRAPVSSHFFSSEAGTPVETAVQTPPKETIQQEPAPRPDKPLDELVQASRAKAPTAEAENWKQLGKQSKQQSEPVIEERQAHLPRFQDALSTGSAAQLKNPTTRKMSSTIRPDHQTSPWSFSSRQART